MHIRPNKLLPALLLLLATSCNKQEDGSGTNVGEGSEPIRFEVTMATATPHDAQTRVATSGDNSYTSTWEEGDEIGVYIVKGNAGLQPSGNWVENAKLTYNGGEWTPSTPLCYPQDFETLNFYAYYPYLDNLMNPTDFVFSVQEDQRPADYISKNDFLAAKVTDHHYDSNPVILRFSHLFAMVELKAISSGIGAQMSDEVIVTVKAKSGANINSFEQTSIENYDKFIKMHRMEQETDANYTTSYTYRAFIPAQSEGLRGPFDFFLEQGNITRTLSYTPSSPEFLKPGEVQRHIVTLQSAEDDYQYAVGDYYPHKGFPILGIVYSLADPVDDKSKHGLIVGLEEGTDLAWSSHSEEQLYASENEKGISNMNKVFHIDPDFGNHPVFAWIHGFNNADEDYSDSNALHIWYLPAYDELKSLGIVSGLNTNGLDDKLVAAGGESLRVKRYWSSTEFSDLSAYMIDTYGESFHSIGNSKILSESARCILAF